MEDVGFGLLGEQGYIEVGEYCYFAHVDLLCQSLIRIGNYVVIGWNTTVADADWHPIAPAERIADAVACSPLGRGPRPSSWLAPRPVVIEDDVWIGPNALILKGVHIGAGAFVEAGAVVSRDVPAFARVMGNPAQICGTV
jgi:acetyltransferase-like isoleucine patch superfamily enzyme